LKVGINPRWSPFGCEKLKMPDPSSFERDRVYELWIPRPPLKRRLTWICAE
jgi:hypothetical protein